MTKRTMAVAGGVTLALALGACGAELDADSGGSDGGDYKVIVLGGLSAEGVLADNASISVTAAQAGVEFTNDELGGVDGRDITIEVIDDSADPTKAVTELREAIASDKPDLVLNSGPSTVAEATLPILDQNDILSFNIGPTATSADPGEFPLNFDMSPSPADQLEAFVPHFEEQGYEKVGVLHGNSSYGETYGKDAEQTFADAGFEVTAVEEYDVAALDMTAQLETVKASQPDVLLLDAYGGPLGYVLKGVQKLGWDVPIVGNTSVAATGLISSEPPSGVLGTKDVENLTFQTLSSSKYDADAAAVNDAVARMKEVGPIKANLFLAYNYDALPLVAAAAEVAGSTDPAELAEALEQAETQEQAETAIIGRYNFTADGHLPNLAEDEFVVIPPSVLKDGQFQ